MILDFADLPHIRATMDVRKKRMQIWLEMPLSLPEYRNDEPSRLCSFRAMEKIRTVSAQTCSGSFIMQMI